MPENQRLADIILTEMAEYLMLNTVFEGMCIGDKERRIEPVDRGIEIIMGHGSVIKDTEYAFVISYAIESEGGPEGIIETHLRGHAYHLPFFKETSKEEALEDVIRTAEHGNVVGDTGWYFIESKKQRERAA